jgi:hypothetical protein
MDSKDTVNLSVSEIEVKKTLDVLIKEKAFYIALNILNNLKDSFPLYDQYMNQIKELKKQD